MKKMTEQEQRDLLYPRDYVVDLDISEDTWVELIKNPKVFKDDNIELVKRMYLHDNHAASASKLANEVGKQFMSYNSPVANLGKRISRELSLKPLRRKDGTNVWWRVPFWGRYLDDGTFEWKLRPELASALERVYPELKAAEMLKSELVEDDNLLADINSVGFSTDLKIGSDFSPKAKEEPMLQNGRKVYRRDRLESMKALLRADHKCEVDKEHLTFIRRNSDERYTEPHHLVPMSASDRFDVSLDNEANIVSLCSNCHNQIHYGKDADILLKKLYDERKSSLEQAGIYITIEELLKLYQY